jgi:hypothetical protein
MKNKALEPEAKASLKAASSSSAIALLLSLRSLYGDEVLKWEPEALWLTLERDSYHLSEVDRDKIQAAIVLTEHPSFYWDNISFQHTVQALNGQPFSVGTLQENHSAHMAWAICEAAVIRQFDPDKDTIPDFDGDVQLYVAVCLRREGFVFPPSELLFADDCLEKQLTSEEHVTGLKKEVKQAWSHTPKNRLAHTEFAENAVGVQLARLAACYLYVEEHKSHLHAELARLGLTPSV